VYLKYEDKVDMEVSGRIVNRLSGIWSGS